MRGNWGPEKIKEDWNPKLFKNISERDGRGGITWSKLMISIDFLNPSRQISKSMILRLLYTFPSNMTALESGWDWFLFMSPAVWILERSLSRSGTFLSWVRISPASPNCISSFTAVWRCLIAEGWSRGVTTQCLRVRFPIAVRHVSNLERSVPSVSPVGPETRSRLRIVIPSETLS